MQKWCHAITSHMHKPGNPSSYMVLALQGHRTGHIPFPNSSIIRAFRVLHYSEPRPSHCLIINYRSMRVCEENCASTDNVYSTHTYSTFTNDRVHNPWYWHGLLSSTNDSMSRLGEKSDTRGSASFTPDPQTWGQEKNIRHLFAITDWTKWHCLQSGLKCDYANSSSSQVFYPLHAVENDQQNFSLSYISKADPNHNTM